MWLLNRDKAFIPEQKFQNYLLSMTHPVGKSKAKFFSNLGFNKTNVDQLENKFLRIAQEEEVLTTKNTSYGTKYIIEGSLNYSQSSVIMIRTVWITEIGNQEQRFVTAYPA